MKVSEIEKVTVVPLKISDLKKVNNEDSSDEQKNVSQNVEGQKKKEASSAKKTTDKKITLSNKTIRVNIERLDALMNLLRS